MKQLIANSKIIMPKVWGGEVLAMPNEENEIQFGVGTCKSCDCRVWRKDNSNSDFFDSYCKCGHHYNQHK